MLCIPALEIFCYLCTITCPYFNMREKTHNKNTQNSTLPHTHTHTICCWRGWLLRSSQTANRTMYSISTCIVHVSLIERKTGMHYGTDEEVLFTVDGTFVLAAFTPFHSKQTVSTKYAWDLWPLPTPLKLPQQVKGAKIYMNLAKK